MPPARLSYPADSAGQPGRIPEITCAGTGYSVPVSVPVAGQGGTVGRVAKTPQNSAAGNSGHAFGVHPTTYPSTPTNGNDTAREFPLIPRNRTFPGFSAPGIRPSTVGHE